MNRAIQQKLSMIMIFCTVGYSIAQNTGCTGKVLDARTNKSIQGVNVRIEGTDDKVVTNSQGVFDFKNVALPLGEQILVFFSKNYKTKRFPVIIHQGETLHLKKITLEYDINLEQLQIGMISLTDHELEEGQSDQTYTVSSLLQASRDTYLKAAAFDFGSSFFRPRGLGSEYGKVLINGIEMNKLSDGRPLWSSWGGLNDVQRNQEFTMGILANEYSFGDLTGVTNIDMRAGQHSAGGRVSYALSNRTYVGRVMATYHSGWQTNGWAYSLSLSRRYGSQGYIEGTLYDANSFFAAVEKKVNKAHSINVTSFYTPNRRGRSTAITKEVFDLKGNTYNPNWGYYNGEKKNASERAIQEPMFMVNHYWTLTDRTRINTSIGFQTGKRTRSRIDTNGTTRLQFNGQETYVGAGRSQRTNPIHPSNLPSFYLQDDTPSALSYQKAFLAQEDLVTDGQLDWNHLIAANQSQARLGKNAIYILYADRNDDSQWSFNSNINSQFSDTVEINAAINYKDLKSINYAEVTDLLGGTGFLDIDAFAVNDLGTLSSAQADLAQNDLRNKNRIVGVGDRYDYNYEITATAANAFAQAQFQYNRMDFFLSGSLSKTRYQRNGLFENGSFPGNRSFGKSPVIDFTNFGIKSGMTWKINGRHALDFHGLYNTKAPAIRNTFANIQKSNAIIPTNKEERAFATDVSYIVRNPNLKSRLTGYYTNISDTNEVGFFFTETISSAAIEETATFAQEHLTGINKQYFGAELGVEYDLSSTVKIKGAAGVGQFTYANNPTLFLSTDRGVIPFGQAFLKGYKLANGPQQAGQIGFEYRDPNFWWVGATTNYFSNAYVDISAFKRTQNFTLDPENGLPFNDFDSATAKSLLQQEQLEDYVLVHVIGGKSWRVKGYYIGFFAVVNNILDRVYRTGGFEQARRANYRTALEEANRNTPVFGNRYFYGPGTSFYVNVYLKF